MDGNFVKYYSVYQLYNKVLIFSHYFFLNHSLIIDFYWYILGVLEDRIRFLRVHLYSSINKASIKDSETHDNVFAEIWYFLKWDTRQDKNIGASWKSTLFSRLTPIMTRLRKSYFIRQMDIYNLLESCWAEHTRTTLVKTLSWCLV